jgi:hypothetical protein
LELNANQNQDANVQGTREFARGPHGVQQNQNQSNQRNMRRTTRFHYCQPAFEEEDSDVGD